MAFLKRFIPFIAAFTLGILGASLFIDIKPQRFGGVRGKRHHKFHAMRAENEELKNELLRLRNEMQDHSDCRKSVDALTGDEIYSLGSLKVRIPQQNNK